MSSEPLLAILRARTSEAHKRLEAALDLMDPALDLAGYVRLVGRFYGAYLPLELALAGAADWDALGFDFDARRKTPWLAADLQALGLDGRAVADLPRCMQLPRVDSLGAALGCLYVLEGSTLGGQVLTRHFSQHLGLTPETGGAFFASYGPQVGAKWGAFRAFLGTHGPEHHDAAGDAAAALFEALATWLPAEAPVA